MGKIIIHSEPEKSLEIADEKIGVGAERRVWDPARSPQLKETIDALISLYERGALKHELRPSTLIALGGDFERFFHSAFKNSFRPQWAIKRYPDGFDSLVKEVNSRLDSMGVVLLNTRQDHSFADRLTESERTTVYELSDLVASGVLSTQRATNILIEEFGITLSNTQINYYFPATECKGNNQFENRKQAILNKVDTYKRHLNIDLAIRACLEGLLFEAYVGVVLRDLSPEASIQRQENIPLQYTDLAGNKRSSVRPDFLVKDSSNIWNGSYEAKLGNHHLNILNSALSQYCALNPPGSNSVMPVNVVYRNPNAFLQLALTDNMRIAPELARMGLSNSAYDNLSLTSILRYVSISELIGNSKNQELLYSVLAEVDRICAEGDLKKIRSLTDWMTRVVGVENQFHSRVETLVRISQVDTELSPNDVRRLFGPRVESSTSSLAVEFSMKQKDDRTLKKLYEALFGEMVDEVTADVLSRIESAPEDQFVEACLGIFIQSLESAEERERLRNLHQTGVLREKEILEQHESLRLRLNSDTLAQLDNLIESAKDKSDAWLIEYQRRFPPIEPNQFRLGGTERRNLERTYMKLSTVEELPPFNEFVGIVNQVATYIRDYKLNTVIEVDQLAIERTTDASVLRTDIRNLKETCNQELSMIRNGRLMLALRRAIERGLKQKRVTSKEIQPLRKIIDRFEGREIDLALSYLNIAADTIAAPFFSLRLTSRNNVLDRAKSRAVSALGVSHRTDVHTTSEISLALHEARENYYSIAVERSLLGQLRRGGTINEIQTCFLTAGEDASFYNLARAVKMDLLLLGLRNSNLWEMYKPKDIRADSLLVLNYPSRFSQPQLGPSNFSLEIMGNIEDVAFSTRQVAMTCAAQLFGGSDIEEFFQNPAIILQDKSLSDKYHEQIANSGLSVFGAVRTVARERLEQAKLLSFIDIEIARNFLQYDPIPFSILDEVPEVAIGLLVKHLRSSDAMFQGLME